MAAPSIHITRNGVKKRFYGGKAGRKCPSKASFPKRPCAKCATPFRPNRRWQKCCNKRCTWNRHGSLKAGSRKKIVRKSTAKAPFGVLVCPTCRKGFSSGRPGKKYCSHECFRLRMSRDWKNRNRASGGCYSCGAHCLPGNNCYCREHWLYQAAWRSGLRGKGRWMEIEDLLVKQNYRCAYTGRELVLGMNASIDHKLPRSLYPGLLNDVSNLEWVDLEVNRAKRTMTRDQFIALCRLVVERADREGASGASGCPRPSPGADVMRV